MTERENMGGAKPGEKRPAPRKLVVSGMVVCEEGEMLTREEFGERLGRALRKAAGISEEEARHARHQGWSPPFAGHHSKKSGT